ncbi:TPA: helix-turn-helix transcriptional regulator [Klebsiella oxytoca]
MPEVLRRTGFGRAWIYRLISAGDFPAQVKIGRRAVGFIETEVDRWVEERVRATREQ